MWSQRIPGWLIKIFVGLPAFYVLGLMISDTPESATHLRALASGYGWQTDVIEKSLPIRHLVTTDTGHGQEIIQLLVAGAILYQFFYWRDGFSVTRRIRRVGDEILEIIGCSPGTKAPPLQSALGRLRSRGWTIAECKAAYWFLMMVNLRISLKNESYEDMSPWVYGIFRALLSVGGAVGLTLLHPVVGGLYFASMMGDARKVWSTRLRCSRELDQLPREVHRSIAAKYERL